jgi:cbb3-type cytochrome oxidase cytochrome c subunit
MAGTYRFLAINDINNGILKAPKAMPQKEIIALIAYLQRLGTDISAEPTNTQK